jgi:hypothetical protein
VRSALLDYEEIPSSLGSSAIIMDSEGHQILFQVSGEVGYILIRRSGWIGFEYKCYINGVVLGLSYMYLFS